VASAHRIQLVCFDLGGVLIRICRTWAEGCAAAGLAVRGEHIIDAISINGRREISQRYQLGDLGCEAYFEALSQAGHGLYSPAEIERIHHAWLLHEYAGVAGVIDRIHAAGMATAALSNTNHAHWVRMPEFPAVMKLQRRLASHELRLAKPDEAIYREAERLLGVRGARILFFDDLAENIDAARGVGWNAVHINHTGDPAQQIEAALEAHHVLT
jgi:glucose-1-phosphatase